MVLRSWENYDNVLITFLVLQRAAVMKATYKRKHLIFGSWFQRVSTWLSWLGAGQRGARHSAGAVAESLHAETTERQRKTERQRDRQR